MSYSVSPDCEVKNLAEIYNKYFYNEYSDDNYAGIFIEIGAYNGRTGSNVNGLAEAGWVGYCIEPEPNNFRQLQEYYANFTNITCLPIAIGKKQKKKLFINFSYTTTSEEQYELYKRHQWMGGYEPVIDIDVIPFNDFLEEYKINKIDVLSIDTEGTELEVLQTFDINKYKPKIILVEDIFGDQVLHDYIISHGYILDKHISYNKYYKSTTF